MKLWVRDVAAVSRTRIKSAGSLLTATTRVTAAGTDADRMAGCAIPIITPGALVACDTVIATTIEPFVIAATGIVISTAIAHGVAEGKHS